MEQPSDYAWIGISAFGALLSVAGFLYSIHARKTWDWPTAAATITRVGTVCQNSQEGEIWYECDFEFEYAVDSRTYAANHLASFNFREVAERVKELRKVGSQFELHYNARNPEDILENGPKNPRHGYTLMADGFVAIAATIPLLIWDLHWAVPTVIAVIGLIAATVRHNQYMSKIYPFERPFPHVESYLRTENPVDSLRH